MAFCAVLLSFFAGWERLIKPKKAPTIQISPSSGNTTTQLKYDDAVLILELKKAGVGVGLLGREVEGIAFSDNLTAHK